MRYGAGDGGRVEGNKTQSVPYGEDGTTVTAVPDTGYMFDKWSDGVTTPTRRDTNIEADGTYTAKFAKRTYAVRYGAGNGGRVDGEAAQSVPYGEDGTIVTALPDTGYMFVRWSDGVTTPARREESVSGEVNVTAEFAFCFAGGDGTLSDPYTIETYAQLQDMRRSPQAAYRLANDLDLAGIAHEPIFDTKEEFTGHFFGDGHAIRNMNVATDKNYPSLFGVTKECFIYDLRIENFDIVTANRAVDEEIPEYGVGAVAGRFSGYMHEVHVVGAVSVPGQNYVRMAVGGLIGYAKGTLHNCSADVQTEIRNVVKGNANVYLECGGMIGECDSSSLENCTATGKIDIADCSANIYAAGLIGYYFTSKPVDAYIRNSDTNVIVTGERSEIGGFMGQVSINAPTVLHISECTVAGDITGGRRTSGFVCEAKIVSDSQVLIDKCSVQNVMSECYIGAGFVYYLVSSNADCRITNCSTSGTIKNQKFDDSEKVGGEVVGFGYTMRGVTIKNCSVRRDLYAEKGWGVAHVASACNVDSCMYEGSIHLKSTSLANAGIVSYFSRSTMKNCYVHVNFVTGNDTNSLPAFIRYNSQSTLQNFYCVVNICGRILGSYTDQQISNGHVYISNLENTELPPDGVDITMYDTIESMYLLADILNNGQEDAVWVNTENGLPRLKFETV